MRDSFEAIFNEQVVNPKGSVTVYAHHLRLLWPTAVGDLYIGKAECGVTATTVPTTTTSSTTTTTRPTTTTSSTTTTVNPLICDGARRRSWARPATTLSGTAGPDVVVGLAGEDQIAGPGGDDLICGAEGNDKLSGVTATTESSVASGTTTFPADGQRFSTRRCRLRPAGRRRRDGQLRGGRRPYRRMQCHHLAVGSTTSR